MSSFHSYLTSRQARPTLADAAIAHGCPVFACDGQKRPLTEHGFKDATQDATLIRRMFAAPAATMIGMPTGEVTKLIVVDVDVKNGAQGGAWLDANSHRMPQTRTIKTASGGLHIYFRWTRPTRNSASKIAPGIDVRGDGGYVIVAPSPGYAVADNAPVADAPEWLGPVLWPVEPVAAPYQPPAPRSAHASGDTPYGLAALDGECDAIRNAGFGSQEHALNAAGLKIGSLIAGDELTESTAVSELLSAGRSMPSQGGRPPWRASDIERKLRRAVADGKGQARVAPERPQEAVHPAAEMLARLHKDAAKEAAKPLQVSADIMDVRGVLKLFVDECTRTAIRPQPFLALGAAICVVGTLAGRRYRTATDLRTNVYIAAIAESGGGKDHAAEIARRAIDAAGLGHYLGGETLASGRAVLSAIETHPAKLFQVDEFGLFLAGVTGKKAAPHKGEIWSELMKLYSRAKGIYRGTEYANKKENPRIDIHQPCVSFYGTTTPSTFWGALEGGAMSDGSLARFLVFISDNNRPDRNWDAGIFAPTRALLDGLMSIASGHGAMPPSAAGNLLGTFVAPMLATQEPDLFTVAMTPDADRLHRINLLSEDDWARQVEGTPKAAIVNRLGENAAKLALISAISRQPSRPSIDEHDVSWAWALAQHCARSLLQDADRFIADSDYERRVNKVLNIVRKHGPITDSQMFDRFNFRMPGRDRIELLQNLVSVGLLLAIPSEPGKRGPKTVRYVIAPAADGYGEFESPDE